jgi:hypothetical protein
MERVWWFFFLLMLLQSRASAECPPGRSLEEYFCLPPERIENPSMNRHLFYTLPEQIRSLFREELGKVKYPLSLDLQWESPFLGAGVTFHEEALRLVVFGGTARIKNMTVDAFAALICHELGHVLGGPPYQSIPGSEWSSAEGQSDFFAASQCLPRYYQALGLAANATAAQVGNAAYQLFSSLRPYSPLQKEALERRKRQLPEVAGTLRNTYPSLQCRYQQYLEPQRRSSCWYKK